MITIGYSTKTAKLSFSKYLEESCGVKDIQIIEKVNPGKKSLTEVYNEILLESENDIVVFCHDDILFEKNYWGKRILDHFNKQPDFGIIGVAGTKYYPQSGRWWEIQGEMVGQVYHQHNGKKWLSEYNKPFGSRIIETIIVDGLFFAVKKSNLKHNFDNDVKGFHFYDTNFCLDNFLSGVKVGVISNVPITHLSIGMTNNEWEQNRLQFIKKFEGKLPIKLPSIYNNLILDNKKPLVSVIVPIFNYGVQFEKTLQSIFDSTYKNIEVIIINDGSTDIYVNKKLESIKTTSNIKIFRQENSGPSSARNFGISKSVGEFILPLDSDDTIDPTYIENCVNVLGGDKNISPVYCDTIHIGEIQGIEKRPEWSMERLKKGPFIVNCSMFSKKAFDDCGGYDTSLYGWEDYDLWIRMGVKGYVGKRIPKPLFFYFHHEKDGTISTLANKNQKELYKRIIEKNFENEIV